MTRKRAFVLALATLFLFLLATRAGAEYRGTDMWSSLMPPSGRDGLADRHPISYYQLDYHVDTSVTGNGITSEIAQFFCSISFFGAAVVMRLVIAIYDWAFSVDLITGAGGGLATTAPVAQQNYQDFAMPFLVTAVICLGAWVAVNAIRRRSSNVGSALARVALMSVLAISIVQHPADTVGRAYQVSDDLATAIISGMVGGDPADRVFETFIYRPWAILQFGGLQVCTGDQLDADGFPVASTTPGTRKVCHSVLKKDADGHGDYARIMSSFAPDSPERNAYYNALREGKDPEISGPSPSDCPRGDCTLTGHRPSDDARHQGTLDDVVGDVKIDRTDAPAVDMMQAGGAAQRFVYTVLIVLCMMAGVLLLGLISIGVLFAQIALLLLVMLAGFMLLAALYPGAHGAFKKWLSLLGKVLTGKVVYALMFGAVLSTSSALLAVGTTIGYLLALVSQALLYGGVFWKRKALLEMITSSKTADRYSNSEHQAVTFVTGAAAAAAGAISGGASTFASTMRQGWNGNSSSSGSGSGRGSGTPNPTPNPTPTPSSSGSGSGSGTPSPGGGSGSSNSTPVPTPVPTQAQTGSGGSPQPQPSSSASGSSEASTSANDQQEETAMKPFSQALAERQEGRDPSQEDDDQDDVRLVSASSHRPATTSNFEEDLDLVMLAQERPVESRVPQPLDE